jgi:hypothetical protein
MKWLKIKKAHISVSFLNTGGRGQNRTADTRIFNCKNRYLFTVLGSPSLALTRQRSPRVVKIVTHT